MAQKTPAITEIAAARRASSFTPAGSSTYTATAARTVTVTISAWRRTFWLGYAASGVV